MTVRRWVGVWIGALVLVAIAALMLALLIGGGAPRRPPPGLTDDRRLAEWVAVIATLMSTLVGMVAVGFGLLAGSSPEHRSDEVRPVLLVTTMCWIVVSVAQLLSVVAIHRGQPGLLESPQVRAVALQLALVLAALGLADLGRRRRAAVAFTIIGLAAMCPVALAGHARTADPVALTTVATALHVGAASLWIGGLVALAWSAMRRADTWTADLRRFSALALMCIAVLAVSGVVAASGHLDLPGGLVDTRYGAVVTIKAVLLAALGIAGWLQRRRVVARLDHRPRRAFLALACSELLLMAGAVALAVALATTPPPP